MAESEEPQRGGPRRTVAWLARAEVRTPLLQAVKAAVATVVAWLLASELFDLAQPFLAPWAALLTVHATVYRSMHRGAETVLATFLGILLSFGAVQLFGYGGLSLGLAVLVGLVVSNVRGLRTEGVTVATTALFVLTAGFAEDGTVLLDRFADTLLGVAVGLVVNMLLVPPLDHGLADRQLDHVTTRLGRLLVRMSEDLSLPASTDHADAWIEETRAIDRELDRAEELLRFSRESHRFNARRRRSRRVADIAAGEAQLVRLEDAVARTRSIARTVGEAVSGAAAWDPRFRDPWLELLADVGARTIDTEAPLRHGGDLRQRVAALAQDLSGEDLPGLDWPVFGSLLHSLHVIVTVVEDVASPETVDVPREPPAG